MDVSEIFPFVLSIGIAIQGIIYIACQTKGLEGLLILGCTSISQAMLPGKFLALDNTLAQFLTTTTSLISCALYPTFLWTGDHHTGAEAATVSTNIKMGHLCVSLPRSHWNSGHVCINARHRGSRLLLCISLLVCPNLEA